MPGIHTWKSIEKAQSMGAYAGDPLAGPLLGMSKRELIEIALMPGWNTSSGGHFVCARCGHDNGWTFNLNITAIKRGLPCPVCNEG